MSIYAFAEMENGRAKRIYASAKYPSKQEGNIFMDCDCKVNLKYADELPLRIEGCYSLVAFRPSHILLSRDVLAGKPLYFDNTTLTFSSFKHYFDEEPFEVLAGEVVKIDYEGNIIERKRFGFDEVFKPIRLDFDEAKERVIKTLEAYRSRIKNGCIAFSGGVDSSLLAGIYDLPLVTVTASKEEREWVKECAKKLGREIEIYEFDEGKVKEVLPDVVKAIETDNKLQISIAIPIYICMSFAKSLGYDEIVFGQGADELFGGYKRYESMSYKELEYELKKDLMEIGVKNLVRDNKISYANYIKLHTPYLQWEIIRMALGLPVELKVKRNGEVIRKFFLREIAREVIPKEIAYRDKKAIQYSTKTAKILRRVVEAVSENKL